MKSKLKITSLMIMSLGMQSAIAQDGAEDWNAAPTVAKSFYDEDLSVEELKAIEDMKSGGTNYWIFSAASSATPIDSDMVYNYAGAGCMNGVGSVGTVFSDQNINIPDGHTITFMRFYYNDTDAAATTRARLFIYNGDGNFTQLEERISDTDTGYASVGASMSYTVDNTLGALLLRFWSSDNASVTPCAVRFVVNSN